MKLYEEFTVYLTEQLGQPYLWSGQHTKLTPENYISVIDKKETNKEYAEAAKEFCKKKFDEGYTVLYAYDCSGLGVYWLYNLKKLYKGDCSANTMMSRCELTDEQPKCGYWVFRTDSKGKATHVGYMVSDTELIEAKGRKYGVVRTAFKAKDWNKWGIPLVFKDELEPHPIPPEPSKQVVRFLGSVRLRKEPTTYGKHIATAHKGDTLPLLSRGYIDSRGSEWYAVEYKGDIVYCSAYTLATKKYTVIEEIQTDEQ